MHTCMHALTCTQPLICMNTNSFTLVHTCSHTQRIHTSWKANIKQAKKLKQEILKFLLLFFSFFRPSKEVSRRLVVLFTQTWLVHSSFIISYWCFNLVCSLHSVLVLHVHFGHFWGLADNYCNNKMLQLVSVDLMWMKCSYNYNTTVANISLHLKEVIYIYYNLKSVDIDVAFATRL